MCLSCVCVCFTTEEEQHPLLAPSPLSEEHDPWQSDAIVASQQEVAAAAVPHRPSIWKIPSLLPLSSGGVENRWIFGGLRRPLEVPGGSPEAPRGPWRFAIVRWFFVGFSVAGLGRGTRKEEEEVLPLAVLPFPSSSFHLPLLLPSPPFPGQCGYGAILDSRHSYSKCPSGPQSSQIPTTSRASSSTAAPSGPMCATGSSIGQGGSEREIRVQSNVRVAPPQAAGSIPSPPRSPPSEPPRAGSLLGSVAPVDEPARSPRPRPSFSSSLDASILRLIVAAPRSTQ